MISLVFFATVINYLDRQTLSVAAPVLREQFHMSNQDYSRVVFAFLLAYTISNGFSGGILVWGRASVTRYVSLSGPAPRCWTRRRPGPFSWPPPASCWASAKPETGRPA